MGVWQIVYIVFIAVMVTADVLTYSRDNKTGFWGAIALYCFLTIVLWKGGFFS